MSLKYIHPINPLIKTHGTKNHGFLLFEDFCPSAERPWDCQVTTYGKSIHNVTPLAYADRSVDEDQRV